MIAISLGLLGDLKSYHVGFVQFFNKCMNYNPNKIINIYLLLPARHVLGVQYVLTHLVLIAILKPVIITLRDGKMENRALMQFAKGLIVLDRAGIWIHANQLGSHQDIQPLQSHWKKLSNWTYKNMLPQQLWRLEDQQRNDTSEAFIIELASLILVLPNQNS